MKDLRIKIDGELAVEVDDGVINPIGSKINIIVDPIWEGEEKTLLESMALSCQKLAEEYAKIADEIEDDIEIEDDPEVEDGRAASTKIAEWVSMLDSSMHINVPDDVMSAIFEVQMMELKSLMDRLEEIGEDDE